jgi:uncharacterized protein YqeY
MIIDTLPQQIQAAMKARDTIRLTTLQMLKSALNYKRIELLHDLSKEEELAVVRFEAKKRKDAIEAYEKAKRDDLAQKEKAELAILEEFLPAPMSDEELIKIIKSVIAKLGAASPGDTGKVIGAVLSQTKGATDGARVSALVKEELK